MKGIVEVFDDGIAEVFLQNISISMIVTVLLQQDGEILR